MKIFRVILIVMLVGLFALPILSVQAIAPQSITYANNFNLILSAEAQTPDFEIDLTGGIDATTSYSIYDYPDSVECYGNNGDVNVDLYLTDSWNAHTTIPFPDQRYSALGSISQDKMAAKFTNFPASTINSIAFELFKVGSPTGNVTFNIMETNHSVIEELGTYDVSTLTTDSFTVVNFDGVYFDTTSYPDFLIEAEYSNNDDSNYIIINQADTGASNAYISDNYNNLGEGWGWREDIARMGFSMERTQTLVAPDVSIGAHVIKVSTDNVGAFPYMQTIDLYVDSVKKDTYTPLSDGDTLYNSGENWSIGGDSLTSLTRFSLKTADHTYPYPLVEVAHLPIDAAIVTTEAPSNGSGVTIQLNGSIILNEWTSADCSFEFGTSTSYGTNITGSTLTGNGTFDNIVSGLSLGQTYHYRALASFNGDTVYGNDQSFVYSPLIIGSGYRGANQDSQHDAMPAINPDMTGIEETPIGNILYEPAQVVSQLTDFPIWILFTALGMVFVVVAIIIVMRVTQNQLMAGAAGLVMVFAGYKMQIFDWWMFFVILVMFIAILVMERKTQF
jgi:hypothetical protein